MKDVLISIGIGFGLVAGAALGIFGATLLMCGMFVFTSIAG